MRQDAVPRVASVFCGAGGLDLGFIQAGFRIVFAMDSDSDSCETYCANIGTAVVGDVTMIRKLPPHDVLIGGPPCQGFSVAGHMDPDDPRSGMVWEFARLLEMSQPPVFVMENVKALAALPRWADVRAALIHRFEELGYHVTVHILSAKDFGVPQTRERAFFVGSKHGELAAPKPSGSPPQARSVLLSFPPPGTLPNSAPCRARVVPARKAVLRKSPFAGMLFNGQGRPINLDSVPGTLPASMGGNRTPIVDEMALRHGSEQWVVKYHSELMSGQTPVERAPEFLRRLTVAEAAAFQGFPRNFTFVGSQSSAYRQIGNAVPPPLARAVAESVFIRSMESDVDSA